MNNAVALYIDGTVIYWNSVIIVLGALAGFCLAYSLYTAYSGRGSAMFVFFAFSLALGIFFSRTIHFYTHQEQYDGLFAALTDYRGGSFFFPGVIIGVMLAAAITRILSFTDSSRRLLDAAAPGLALAYALIRLSFIFTSSCRGKISITQRSLQHLPLASAVTMPSGAVEYRLATFFLTFILMLLLAIFLVFFYIRHHGDRFRKPCPREGHVFRMYIIFYGVTELIMDSTRNDSTFPYFAVFQTLNRFASFVSLTQIFCAVAVLIVFIKYYRESVRANGKSARHIVLWVLYILSLAGAGVSEYMVQRHGDMYVTFYSTMGVSAVLMALSAVLMYRTCRIEKKKSE